MASAAQSDLFNYQANILKRNNLVIDLGAYKTKGVADRTEKILRQTTLPSANSQINAAAIINAAAHTQGLDSKEALRKLLAVAAKRPNDVGLTLTIVQLQLQQEQAGAALTTLTTFLSRLESSGEANDTDVRFSPGLVALAVTLFRSQKRDASAKAEIVKAAQYWQNRPSLGGLTSSLLALLALGPVRRPVAQGQPPLRIGRLALDEVLWQLSPSSLGCPFGVAFVCCG